MRMLSLPLPPKSGLKTDARYDGGDLVVRNLMAAVHKLDRASRTRNVIESRSDPFYSRYRALPNPCRRTLRERGCLKSKRHCKDKEETHHILLRRAHSKGPMPARL